MLCCRTVLLFAANDMIKMKKTLRGDANTVCWL